MTVSSCGSSSGACWVVVIKISVSASVVDPISSAGFSIHVVCSRRIESVPADMASNGRGPLVLRSTCISGRLVISSTSSVAGSSASMAVFSVVNKRARSGDKALSM